MPAVVSVARLSLGLSIDSLFSISANDKYQLRVIQRHVASLTRHAIAVAAVVVQHRVGTGGLAVGDHRLLERFDAESDEEVDEGLGGDLFHGVVIDDQYLLVEREREE